MSNERTHFEEFSKAGGVLFIKEHFKTPSPKARFGKLVFDIRRISNPRTGDSAIALRIEYTDQYDNQWIDLVDEEELPSLLSAAQECISQRESLSGLLADYIEFIFTTRSGFGLGMYHEKKSADSGEWIKVAGTTCFLRDLADLVKAIERSIANIARLRTILGENADDADEPHRLSDEGTG